MIGSVQISSRLAVFHVTCFEWRVSHHHFVPSFLKVMMANTAPFLLLIEVCPPGEGPVPLVEHCPEYQTVDTIVHANM